MSQDTGKKVWFDSMTGGLDTKRPAHALDSSMSPDLRNITFTNGACEKRGGFTPLAKERPGMNSIGNKGHHGTGTDNHATPAEHDFINVPGNLVAGHREVYDSLGLAYSIDFFLEIDDLSTTHGGNGRVAHSSNPFGGAPYTVYCRPIISKGPIRKTYHQGSGHAAGVTGTDGWDDSIGYGPTGTTENPGCPFFVYLYNNSGNWEFRFSLHRKTATNYILDTAAIAHSVNFQIRTGQLYHVIASTDGTDMFLRIGVWESISRSYTYTTTALPLTGTAPADSTPTPIQIFDAPQQLIENPSASTAFVNNPPGIGVLVGGGGYWFGSLRFEGKIEDIAIWKGKNLAAGTLNTLDRTTKLDESSLPASLINYWPATRIGDGYVQEVTGRGNHLYLSPGVPVFDGASGGVNSTDKGSWHFNGQNSYAMVDLAASGIWNAENPNWRWQDLKTDVAGGDIPMAFFREIIRGRYPFGIEARVWVDSIGEPFEQVIMEIHSLMRLVLDVNGKFKCYVQEASPLNYSASVQSTFVAKPGRRYNVTAMWEDATLSLYIDNEIDASTSITVWPATVDAPGGITIGAGSRYLVNAGDLQGHPTTTTALPNDLNVDGRSVYLGRIESCRILSGKVPPKDKALYRDEIETDLRYETSKLWQFPLTPTGSTIDTSDVSDNSPNIGKGHALESTNHGQAGFKSVYTNTTDQPGSVLPTILGRSDGGREGVTFPNLDRDRMEIYYVLSQWDMNLDVDKEFHNGFYAHVEWRDYGGVVRLDEDRGTIQQASPVSDRLARLGPLIKRSIEPDWIAESTTGVDGYAAPSMSHRVRPYWFRSPWEIRPRIQRGLVSPALGSSRISLLADWHHQESGESFVIGASGRHFYWVKPIWRRDSPFKESTPRSLWLSGASQDFFLAVASDGARQGLNDGTFYPKNVQTVQVWVKPNRIDGNRMLAVKGTPGSNTVDWFIGFRNGSLMIGGTSSTSNHAYMYEQAEFAGGVRKSWSSLKANEWNRIDVELSSTDTKIYAWINGDPVTLNLHDTASSGGILFDSFAGHSFNTPSGGTLIGGLPSESSKVTFTNSSAATLSIKFESWDGYISDFAMTDATLGHTVGESIPILPNRHTAGSSTTYYYPFSEGDGWAVMNGSAAFPLDGATSYINEIISIGDDAEESSTDTYSYAVFRDRLIVTNGASRPREIKFTKFSDPEGSFRIGQLGMIPPWQLVNTVPGFVASPTLIAGSDNQVQVATSFSSEGIILIYQSFINEDSSESEPFLLYSALVGPVTFDGVITCASSVDTYTFTLATATLPAQFVVGQTFTVRLAGWTSGSPVIDDGTYEATFLTSTTFSIYVVGASGTPVSGTAELWWDGIRVTNAPRSHDQQVIARKFYMSAIGGGAALENTLFLDNETQEVELLLKDSLTGFGVEFNRKNMPQRARHIAVGSSTVFLGNLPDLPAGGNALQWSDGSNVSYFPGNSLVVLDSEDGDPITGIKNHLGRFYLFKQRSTWQFAYRGQVSGTNPGATLQVVNKSSGIGGGATIRGNVIYGAGDRGIEAFDGANFQYLSQALEGDWDELDITNEDLLSMHGAYHRQLDEYWLSVRAKGELDNSRVYVLVANGEGYSWSRWQVPPHTFMSEVTHPVSRESTVIIGSNDGQVLTYNPTTYIDGNDGTNTIPSGEGTLEGVPATISATVLTIDDPTFDEVWDGLRGMPIVFEVKTSKLVSPVPLGYPAYLAIATATVEKASGTTLTYANPIGNPADYAAADLRFYIGGYDAYWTSPWLAPQERGRWLETKAIDLEFEADPTSLLIGNRTVIAGQKPTRVMGAPELHENDLTEGFQSQPSPTVLQNRGRFFRVLFGSRKINDRFSLSSWGVRFQETGIHGQPR